MLCERAGQDGEALGWFDGGDLRSVVAGECSRRAADSGSHVEDSLPGRDVGELCERERAGAAERVEFVHAGEVVGVDMVDVASSGADGREDGCV